jgi:hypothetical protein
MALQSNLCGVNSLKQLLNRMRNSSKSVAISIGICILGRVAAGGERAGAIRMALGVSP